MNYSWTRHYQRYEYLALKGYITGKSVMDIGAGSAFGSNFMTKYAKEVYAVDPVLTDIATNIKAGKKMYSVEPATAGCDVKRRFISAFKFEDVIDKIKVDVAVAVEVFEHAKNPSEFISDIANVAEFAFLTTPMVGKTISKPENQEHVAEYSRNDFYRIVEEKFKILDFAYQFSNLTIKEGFHPKLKARGHSLNENHIVQMVWCKRKK